MEKIVYRVVLPLSKTQEFEQKYKNYIDIKFNLKKHITIEQILQLICTHFNITKEQLQSSIKKKEYSYPRQVLMYLCVEYTDINQNTILNALKRKSNGSIYHAYKTITNLLYLPKIQSDVLILEKQLCEL